MLWLPPLTADCDLKLPLGHAAAAALAELLLAQPEIKPELKTSWLTALSQDPGLLLWSVCRASADGARLQTVAQVSDWLIAGGWRELSHLSAGPASFGPAAQELYADRVAKAIVIAESASQLAERDGAVAIADQASLLALLSPQQEWFVAITDTPADVQLPVAVGRWLNADSPAARYVRLARENAESESDTPAVAEEIRRRWHTPIAPWDQHLAALLSKLARLAQLETDFQRTLEAEKLESLAEFAAGAGHEINNPLAVISGRAQLFLREEKDPERRRELAVINGQAMRVHEMIADLMLFARPPRPRSVACNLVAILDSIAADISPRAVEAGIALVCTWPAAGINLRADAVQLQVALRAVCDNALNALSRGGRLEITARQSTPTAVQIVMQDNGPGISPEVRRHLFDPFFSGSGAGRGLGLGLSKCWRIVTQHGGQIEVESEPGRGSKFMITLSVEALQPQ